MTDVEKFVDQKWGGALWGPPDVPFPRYREGLIEAIKLLRDVHKECGEHLYVDDGCPGCRQHLKRMKFLKGHSDD